MHQGIFCDRQAWPLCAADRIRPLPCGPEASTRATVHIFTTMINEASSLHEANLHVRKNPLSLLVHIWAGESKISAILPVQDLLLSGRPWLWPHCYLELTITYCCGETASIHPAISGHASFDNMKIIRWDSSAHDPKILQIFRRKAIQHDNIVRAMPLLAIEMQVVVVVTAAGFSNTARTSCGRGFHPNHLSQ